MILIKLYIFIGFVFISKPQSIFRPNLPIGKYRLVVRAIRQCDNTQHLPIQVRIYLNRKSSNVTEFRGNVSIPIPMDDSLIFDGNVESWSLTGGWKPNSIVYVTTNGCTKAKLIAGNAWKTFLKAFNVPTENCPIPAGNYSTSTGYDIALLEDNNAPKVYFYGKYKYIGKMRSRDNKLLGCMAYEVELLRPWEGKYRMVVRAIRQCDNTKHLPIQVRLYLNRKSSNVTEFRGYFSIPIPMDDSLIFDGNVESWSLTGGWKPNSIVIVTTNGCTKAKLIAGNAWKTFLKAFNVPTENCPIPAGNYSTSTGYDTALLEDNNAPKVYFYGKYKFVGKMRSRDNKLLGCMTYEVELIRPWDVDFL